MFAQKVGMYGLLFCVFTLIIGIPLNAPLYEVVLKVCKANEKIASAIVLFIIGLLAYVLVKLIGSPVVDFLDILFCTKFRR